MSHPLTWNCCDEGFASPVHAVLDPIEVVAAALGDVMGACDCELCAEVVVEALRKAGYSL